MNNYINASAAEIVEYHIGFNSEKMLVLQQFSRTTGKVKILPLVVKDNRIYVEEKEV